MRALFVSLVVSALGVALIGAPGAPRAADRFESATHILAWIDGYRADPEPAQLPVAVHAMSRLGLFTSQSDAAFYIGFMAGVLGDNQLEARTLVKGMFPMPPERQAPIIKAIAFSGLPNWKQLLATFAERMPVRKVLIDKYLYGGGKTLFELEPDAEPNLLDTLWGYYFATGYYDPVIRIMKALRWRNEEHDLERLTIASMAAWTLASNAARNQELLDLYYVQRPHQPEVVAAALGEIIEAVEMFDSERIRKKALASIEDLKRRPPKAKSTWERWTQQAGATAIALGCVTASATGHPEIAAACVVGGALYTGASRLIQNLPDGDADSPAPE